MFWVVLGGRDAGEGGKHRSVNLASGGRRETPPGGYF